MRSILYFSTTTEPMSEHELVALGKECAENDGHVGITGMLLHKCGDFLQVIEGPNCVARDMFVRISTDPRHKNIRKISERSIPFREFDGRAVGFQDLDRLPSDTPFLSPFSYEAFKADPELAMLALSYFFRNPKPKLEKSAAE